jgi:hypothetical protein
MNIKKLLAVITVLALAAAFAISASALEGEELLEKVDAGKTEEIKSEKEEREAEAVQKFLYDRQGTPLGGSLIKSEITDEELATLKLSDPIPVIGSSGKYLPGDSYLSKAESRACLVIGYVKEAPVCTIEYNQNGEAFSHSDATLAESLHFARERLIAAQASKSENEMQLVILASGGMYYLADLANGTVAAAIPPDISYLSECQGIVTLDAFALAFEESVIYYAERFAEVGVVEDGGNKILELLFAGNTPAAVTASAQSAATPWLTVAICAGGAALLGAAALVTLKKRGANGIEAR